MSDGIQHEPAVPLKHPGWLRPSWLRRLWPLAVAVPVAVGVALGVAIIGRHSDTARVAQGGNCESAAARDITAAVRTCDAEFQRTHEPATGLRLVDALYQTNDYRSAKQVAKQLLTTSMKSGALQFVGQIALEDGRIDEALRDLEEARGLHHTENNLKEHARDDSSLASVRTARSEYAEALRLLDECITDAKSIHDVKIQRYCHLAAARTLIRMGAFQAANRELRTAADSTGGTDADLEYQRASQAQETDDHETAVALFRKAMSLKQDSSDTGWILNTELNLAYSLAELHQTDEALLHLKSATLVDTDHRKTAERTWVEARIAYRQHDLARAAALTDDYARLSDVDPEHDTEHADDPKDRDNRIDVAMLRAQIELSRSDLAGAERWARYAVKQVELVRGAQPMLELRPWILKKWRLSYELLFTALARAGRDKDATMVFDQWQGRTVQDALATRRTPGSLDRRGIADQITRLGKWLPVTSRAGVAAHADGDAVLRTMRGIDLLALIVADGEVWRLTVNHGPPQLLRIAPLAQIKDRIEDFGSRAATDVRSATELGVLLVPDHAFRATRDVLHVLLDDAFKGLPMAALRHGAKPLSAVRPIVRVLRLPETRCIHVTRSGLATVLADPGHQLTSARREGEQVAELLHTTSQTGAAATKRALFAAESGAVLHVAGHGEIDIDGATITLADGGVSAAEISAQGHAPSLVVLSVCNAAVSDDGELAGSLAAGFLAAGAQHVVGTSQAVSDDSASEVSVRFYLEGGVVDPARALAAVQSALANTSNTAWPHFAVFGLDVCREDQPNNP